MVSQARAIQMCYPDEPDWDAVPDDVLVESVLDFQNEQACATSGIYELSIRKHPQTRTLAQWLLLQEEADKWLRASAKSVLGRGVDA